MAKKLIMIFTAFIMIAIVGQGCYTLIQHPRVEEIDHSQEYYSSHCFECHGDMNSYPYGSDIVSAPGYWENHYNWGSYYTFPWWWESYWWDIDISANTSENDPADRRRGWDIINPGGTTIPAPGEITNQTPPSSGSGGTSASGDDSGDSGKTKETETKKSEDTNKAERRRLPEKEKK